MAKNSLDAIRAKLMEKANRGRSNSGSSGGDNASFPFWNIPEGSSATIRFLPDKDENNPLFWREREIIRLPFAGVVGGQYPTTAEVTVTVPCIDMFGEKCPIIQYTKAWWNDESKKDMARRYWKKRSFITQGFVVSSPMNEDAPPASPIRRFVINKSIYDIIYNSLMDPEMENAPTDYVGGRDFIIRKTKKDKWANYSTSSWSLKTRSLSVDELEAIEDPGLHDLKEFLGKKPDAEGRDIIEQMFHDSLDGKPFDSEHYGKYGYRAFGGGNRGEDGGDDLPAGGTGGAARSQVQVPSRAVSTPTRMVAAAAPVVDEEQEEAPAPVTRSAPRASVSEAAEEPQGKADPAAILARIRAKTNAGAAR